MTINYFKMPNSSEVIMFYASHDYYNRNKIITLLKFKIYKILTKDYKIILRLYIVAYTRNSGCVNLNI